MEDADFLAAYNASVRDADLPDVQSDWLQVLDTRMVIPLRRTAHFPAVKVPEQLCPVITVAGEACLLETPKMAAVPLCMLNAPVVLLGAEQSRIVAALDFLFQFTERH